MYAFSSISSFTCGIVVKHHFEWLACSSTKGLSTSRFDSRPPHIFLSLIDIYTCCRCIVTAHRVSLQSMFVVTFQFYYGLVLANLRSACSHTNHTCGGRRHSFLPLSVGRSVCTYVMPSVENCLFFIEVAVRQGCCLTAGSSLSLLLYLARCQTFLFVRSHATKKRQYKRVLLQPLKDH